MSNFGLYVAGFVIFTVGLAAGAHLLGVPPLWIGIGVLVLLGAGIMSAVTRTRNKETPEPPEST